VPPPLQGRDGNEPAPVPEASPTSGSPALDARGGARRRRGGVPRRVREPVPVRAGVPAALRQLAASGRGRAPDRGPAGELGKLRVGRVDEATGPANANLLGRRHFSCCNSVLHLLLSG